MLRLRKAKIMEILKQKKLEQIKKQKEKTIYPKELYNILSLSLSKLLLMFHLVNQFQVKKKDFIVFVEEPMKQLR